MCTTVPSFDAMPQLMASILEKLETLEQKFDALQSNNNVEVDAWFSLQDLCNYLLTIQPNKRFTAGRVIVPFPSTRMERASSSVSRKSTIG